MDYQELYRLACEARLQSHNPYSHFAVGAALETRSGKVYVGCNVENASYGGCICAERTAFVKAISEGERDFVRIAIVGGKNGEPLQFCAPCGICRQFMAEFCSPSDFEVILYDPDGTPHAYTLGELIPLQFTEKDVL